MKMLNNKLKSRGGATMLMALLLMLIVVMVCFVIIQAAMSSSSATAGINPYAQGGSQEDLGVNVSIVGDTSFTYNGNAQGDAVAVVVTNNKGDSISDYEITYEPHGKTTSDAPTLTDVGSTVVHVTVSRNGEICETSYTLEINRLDVTVTADSVGKAYGAKDPALTVTVDPASVSVDYTVSRSAGEAVGTYTITPTGSAIQGNYAVTFVPGTFTIGKIDSQVIVTVRMKPSTTVTYNGQAQTVGGTDAFYAIESGDISNGSSLDFLPEYIKYVGTSQISKTNAGEYTENLSASDFRCTNDNFSNVTIKFKNADGTVSTAGKYGLTINRYETTIYVNQVKDASARVYGTKTGDLGPMPTGPDGNPIKDKNGNTITASDIKYILYKWTSGDTPNSSNTVCSDLKTDTLIDVGTYRITARIADESKFPNYTFRIGDAKNYVVKKDSATVTIVGHNSSVTYDGKNHTVSGYEVSVTSGSGRYTNADFTFSGSSTVTASAAGKTYMGLSSADFTNNNNNFDVTFNVTDGYINITQITGVVVTVKAKSATYTYDKQEYSLTGTNAYEVVGISNPEYTAEDFSYNGSGVTATNASSTAYTKTLTASDFTNNNARFKDVTFEVQSDLNTISLKINPKPITIEIKGGSKTRTYNGKNHTLTAAITESSDYDSTKVRYNGGTAMPSVTKTDAGTYSLSPLASAFSYTDTNYSATFNITKGTLTINPITDNVTVTVKGSSASYWHDGSEHTVSASITASNSLYKLSDMQYTGTGATTISRTAIGKTSYTLTGGNFKNISSNFTNVTFTVESGTLSLEIKDPYTPSLDVVETYYKQALNAMHRGEYRYIVSIDSSHKYTITTQAEINMITPSAENVNQEYYVATDNNLKTIGCNDKTDTTVVYNDHSYSEIIYQTHSASEALWESYKNYDKTSVTTTETVSADGDKIPYDVSVTCTAKKYSNTENYYDITIVLTCGGQTRTISGSIKYNSDSLPSSSGKVYITKYTSTKHTNCDEEYYDWSTSSISGKKSYQGYHNYWQGSVS